VPRPARKAPVSPSIGARHLFPRLETELGAAPVPALRIVPDGVVGAHADPVGDGAVLALLLGQLLLDPEGLVGRHGCGGGGGGDGTFRESRSEAWQVTEYSDLFPCHRNKPHLVWHRGLYAHHTASQRS
jgi:hypothetical protein